MLELGRAGSAGAGRREFPVLHHAEVVGRLSPSVRRRPVTATVEGCDLVFGRAGSRLVGRRAERLAGEARMWVEPSMWRTSWRGSLHGTRMELHTLSQWRCTYRVDLGGVTAGTSGSTGGFRPRPTLALGGDVPLDEQVFLLWVLLVAAWKFQRSGPAPWVAGLAAPVIGGS